MAKKGKVVAKKARKIMSGEEGEYEMETKK
jgi:hypothetical protein